MPSLQGSTSVTRQRLSFCHMELLQFHSKLIGLVASCDCALSSLLLMTPGSSCKSWKTRYADPAAAFQGENWLQYLQEPRLKVGATIDP